MTTTTAATIPSSTDMRLQAIALRIYDGGPSALLSLMRATLTASAPIVAFERIGAATLPVPAHLVRGAHEPLLRLVK